MKDFLDNVIAWLLSSGVRILVIIIVTVILLWVIKALKKKFVKLFLSKVKTSEEAEKRARTLSSVIRSVLVFVLFAVAIMLILSEIGIDLGPILAAAGVVGLAVGFGAQSLVKDIIAGFFILLEDQIRVGDVVITGGKGGLVESVNIRRTVLRDLEGNVHIVPHGDAGIVTNMTKEYSRYVFNVGVAYREDVDQVIEVLKEIGEEMMNDPDFKDDIMEPLEIMGLDEFADSAIVIKARFTTKPIKQWRIGREFNRRMKKTFDERGIEIPFPHITLYPGEDKEGKAAALNLNLKKQE